MPCRGTEKEGIMRKNRSISYKLVFIILAIWIPFSVFVLTALGITTRKIANSSIENQKDKVIYFSALLDADIEKATQYLYVISESDEVEEFLELRKQGYNYQVYLAYQKALQRMKDYKYTSMFINDVFFYLPDSEEILSVNRSLIDMSQDDYPKMQESFEKQGKSFFASGDKLTYLFRGTNGILVGIELSLRDLNYTLMNFDQEGEYKFFFINSENGDLLGNEMGITAEDRAIYNELDLTQDNMEMRVNYKTYLVYTLGNPNNHFYIVIYMEKWKSLETLQFVYIMWTIIGAILIIIPFFLSFFIKKLIEQPMRKLQKAMEMVENEVYSVELKKDESREFNYVFEQYNSMVKKIRTLIQEVLEKQVQVQQAKIKQLQMQINPHFLFNSLYTGYRMAKAQESDQVADLCMYLGDYFSVLTYVSDEYILMENEIKFIDTYLSINKIRFEDKLNYEISCDKELMDRQVPPLLLQPLVENAIMHGVEHGTKRCTIQVDIKEDARGIYFAVRDNSKVLTLEKIDEIKQILKEQKMQKKYFGLWNIQKRLTARKGISDGLHLELVDEENWFQVSFWLIGEGEGHV